MDSRDRGGLTRWVPAVASLLVLTLASACSGPGATSSSTSPSASPSVSEAASSAAPSPSAPASSPAAKAADAKVVRVIDGDTIVVRDAQRQFTVRFLNVDTPETKDPSLPVECLGPEATAFTQSKLPAGTPVWLTYDQERVDKYGRDLAVVSTATTTSLSVDLAEAGLGSAMVIQPNRRHYPEVLAAEERASARQVGLFDPSSACTPVAKADALISALDQAEQLPAQTAEQAAIAATELAAALAAADALVTDGADGSSIWPALLTTKLDKAKDSARSALSRAQATANAAPVPQAPAAPVIPEVPNVPAPPAAPEVPAAPAVPAAPEAPQAPAAPAAPAAPVVPAAPAAPQAPTGGTPNIQTAPGNGYGTNSDYPGYRGPRCYAPGGLYWRPC